MRFKDLELFNLSLLGKYGCGGFFSAEDTLCPSLEDEVCPRSGFLRATIPWNALATWQVIIVDRQAMMGA
jgi:hypothetical protein